MKVFVILCLYILLLYLPLQVIPENIEAVRNDSKNQSRNIEQSSMMKTFNEEASRGNELQKQYTDTIRSVGSWMYAQSYRNWISVSKVVKSIPLIQFAIDHMAPVNGKSGIEEEVFGEQVNLAKTLEHPELIKPLFSQEDASKVALKSMELVAGPKVTETVDEFIKEVTEKSKDKNEDGIQGITGEHLFNILQNSPNIKKLFPQEESTKSIQMAVEFFDSSLCVDDSKTKKPGVVSEKGVISNQNGKGENAISNGVPKTISNNFTMKKSFSKFRSSVTNVAATGAQMAFNVGKLMLNEKQMISTISCFLPSSYSKTVLKFLCIATYLMVLAQQKGVMPIIDNDTVGRVNKLTGLEIGLLVDKLNNPELMKKAFPLNDDSNYAVSILKFLAGGEMNLIDKVIKMLRQFKDDHEADQKELTISDLLKDPIFFKNLLEIPEINQFTTKMYERQLLNTTTKSVKAFKFVRSPTIPEFIKDYTISDSIMKMPEITKLNEVVVADERRVGERNKDSDKNIKQDMYLLAATYNTATESNFQDVNDEEEASKLPPSAK